MKTSATKTPLIQVPGNISPEELQKYENLSASLNSLTDNTRESYYRDLRDFKDFINIENILDSTMLNIAEYLKHLKNTSYETNGKSGTYSNATIARKYSALASFFEKARVLGIIHDNPAHVLATTNRDLIPTVDRRIRQELSWENVKEVIQSTPDARVKALIETLARTGMRISELRNIANANVSVGLKHVSIQITGKRRKTRVIYIPLTLYQQIREAYPYESEFLFANKSGKPYTRQTYWMWISDAFENALGIHIHPHSMRHFYCTQKLAKERLPMEYVARQVGHARLDTLKLYLDGELTPEETYSMPD